MPHTFRTRWQPAVYFLVTLVLGKPAQEQRSAEREEGVPVTDPLVIACETDSCLESSPAIVD